MSPEERLKNIFGVAFHKQDNLTRLRQFHSNNAYCLDTEGNLQGICACENTFRSLELPVEGLEELIYLNLSDNTSLEKLEFTGPLPRLQHFDLSDSQVQELGFPEGFEALTWLDVSRNQLSQMVLSGELPALWYMDASGNQLSQLILSAPKLQYLYLNSNILTDLKFPIVSKALEVLQLRDNQLDRLPDNFLDLEGLKILFLHGNPMKEIPATLIAEGETENSLEAVQGYLESLRGETIKNETVKLIVLGNSTAGKTSLVDYLVYKRFKTEGETSTDGIKHEVWRPEEGLVVNIWDFGGQEFYHATHRLFLTDNAVSMVLFEEATNRQAEILTDIIVYEGEDPVPKKLPLQHFPFSYWLENLHYFSQEAQPERTLLIQSKMDQGGIVRVKDREKQHYGLQEERIFQISTQGAYEKIRKFERKFEDFEEALLEVLKEARKDFEFSVKWVAIIEQLEETEATQPFLPYVAYQKLCRKILESTEADDRELNALTQHLLETGIILYYPHIEALKEILFINPTWVTDIIYKVMNWEVRERKGKFDRAHVEAVVEKEKRKYPGDWGAEQVLSLMSHFQLIFSPQDSSDVFIAAQYLPKGDPSVIGMHEEACGHHAFTLRYPSFLPRSVMTGFICQYGNLATNERYYWKEGIIFPNDGFVHVQRQGDKSIQVMTQKESCAFIPAFFEAFRKLNKRHPEVEVSVNGKDFVKVEDLLAHPLQNPIILSTANQPLQIDAFHRLLQGHSTGLEANRAPRKPKSSPKKKKGFISYARKKDSRFFQAFYQGIQKFSANEWEIFYDQQTHMSEKWDDRIQQEIQDCEFAILFLSQEFLNSTYIMEKELPIFLQRNKTEGLPIFQVLLSTCEWQKNPDLSQFQLFNAYGQDYGLGNFRDKQITFAQLYESSVEGDRIIKTHDLDLFFQNFVSAAKEVLASEIA